jgi:hypothetical protein
MEKGKKACVVNPRLCQESNRVPPYIHPAGGVRGWEEWIPLIDEGGDPSVSTSSRHGINTLGNGRIIHNHGLIVGQVRTCQVYTLKGLSDLVGVALHAHSNSYATDCTI